MLTIEVSKLITPTRARGSGASATGLLWWPGLDGILLLREHHFLSLVSLLSLSLLELIASGKVWGRSKVQTEWQDQGCGGCVHGHGRATGNVVFLRPSMGEGYPGMGVLIEEPNIPKERAGVLSCRSYSRYLESWRMLSKLVKAMTLSFLLL